MHLKYLLAKIIKKLHTPAITESNIYKTSKICAGSHIVGSKISRYSYVGNYCTIINTEIGQFCSIADNCIIGGAQHPIDWVSTSPVFYSEKNIMKKNFTTYKFDTTAKTLIGNDVWIGSNCLIKSGVRVGNGSIIGMGSVLTKNVDDYEIWAGNPAIFIRKRFDEKTISNLLDIRWWDLNDEELSVYAKDFNNPKGFIESYQKGNLL